MTQIAATVIGAGSVGLGMAASLALAGQRVTLMARRGAVEALRATPITVSGMYGDQAVPPGTTTVEDAAHPSKAARDCDMLVVTTKAHDIAAALAPFSDAAALAVLSMHNGIGASETIRAVMGPAMPVYASVIMIGLERQGLAHVVITAIAGPIRTGLLLGDATAPLAAFVAAAQAGVLPICADPAIRDTVLFKLLFSTCMNPTGALTGPTYGGLINHAATLGLIERLADETLAVLLAEFAYTPAATGAAFAHGVLPS